MSDKRLTGGAAFPVVCENGLGHISNGMTLRDWFAGMALQGRLANSHIQAQQEKSLSDAIKAGNEDAFLGLKWETEWAYWIADAMLKEREK